MFPCFVPCFYGVKTVVLDAVDLGASDLVGIVAWKGGEGLGSKTLHIQRLTLTMLMRHCISRQKMGREMQCSAKRDYNSQGTMLTFVCIYHIYIHIKSKYVDCRYTHVHFFSEEHELLPAEQSLMLKLKAARRMTVRQHPKSDIKILEKKRIQCWRLWLIMYLTLSVNLLQVHSRPLPLCRVDEERWCCCCTWSCGFSRWGYFEWGKMDFFPVLCCFTRGFLSWKRKKHDMLLLMVQKSCTT